MAPMPMLPLLVEVEGLAVGPPLLLGGLPQGHAVARQQQQLVGEEAGVGALLALEGRPTSLD